MKMWLKIGAIALSLAVVFAVNRICFIDYYASNALFGSYGYKYERGSTINEPKVILIGGSATNLGLNSRLFEEISGKPAVNMAVSAGVPLRVYMKGASNIANCGDSIIMVLEYNYYRDEFYDVTETYIDMVNIYPELKCKETLYGNLEYLCNNFLRSFTRVNDCFNFVVSDFLKNENAIFNANSVDEYGDFYLHKDKKATYKRQNINEQFVYDEVVFEEILKFIQQMEDKGVSVYLTFPPIDGKRFENYEEYFCSVQTVVERYVDEEKILGTPFGFIYQEDMFFDSAYHLSFENRDVFTQDLLDCYLKK